MLTSKEIIIVAGMLSRHTNFAYANYLYDLSKMDINSEEFIDKAGSGFVWGGMGSMQDAALCNTPLSIEVITADSIVLDNFFVELAEHLQDFEFPNKKLVTKRLSELKKRNDP